MKVCFVVGTLGRGGAEKQLVLMLKVLKNIGITAKVLCLTKDEFYEAEIKSLGIEVEYVGERQNRLLRLGKIIHSLRNEGPDIIQSSHFYTNIYAGFAGKICRIPSIGAIRSNLTSELKINGFWGKFQLFLPDFLIVNSELARQNAIKRGIAPNKIEFVRNAVEICREEPEISFEKKGLMTFLFVGRLSKEKRPDRFVRFAAGLVKRFPAVPLRFQIAGDGVLRKEIEEQVKTHPLLANKFEFLGEQKEMSAIYRQSNVLVLTSDYEGTPNVVLEAMMHGLPVIAAKVGGVPEILNEKCGISVEPDDENGFLKAGTALIENSEQRLSFGLEGFRYIKNNHSLERLTGHLTQIYSGLVKSSTKNFRLKQIVAEKNQTVKQQ